MKKLNVSRSVFWGAVLILAALILILEGAGVSLGTNIGPIRIIAAVLFAAWFIYDAIKMRFARIFFPLAFLFIAIEPVIANAVGDPNGNGNLINNWVVLLAALLLTVGLKMLLPKSDGYEKAPNTRKLGNSTLYVNANDPSTCLIKDNLGNVKVFTVNRDEYAGGGKIEICDNLGDVTVYLPLVWTINAVTTDNLGYVYVPKQDQNADRNKIITLSIHNNLGRVQIIQD
ncbi:MAG: hypothetical protein IJV00_01420 [Clostridia bacterium]|nr:hypothetical protein [Clostridia bacterium]